MVSFMCVVKPVEVDNIEWARIYLAEESPHEKLLGVRGLEKRKCLAVNQVWRESGGSLAGVGGRHSDVADGSNPERV